MGRETVVGIATRYELDGPGIECRWRFFRTRPKRLCGPPSLLQNGYSFSFLGLIRRWRGFGHPFPSSAGVYFKSPSGPSWPVLEWTFHFTIMYVIAIYTLRFCYRFRLCVIFIYRNCLICSYRHMFSVCEIISVLRVEASQNRSHSHKIFTSKKMYLYSNKNQWWELNYLQSKLAKEIFERFRVRIEMVCGASHILMEVSRSPSTVDAGRYHEIGHKHILSFLHSICRKSS